MPDPVSSTLASGQSTTATTAVSFAAQPAGTLLTLHVAADDYKTGDPSGWTVLQSVGGSGQYHGSYFWYKIATGSETSVSYIIGSGSRSLYLLRAHTNIASASPVDGSAQQQTNSSATTYTTPTVASTAGRRYAIAHLTGSNGGGLFTSADTFLNSYTQSASAVTTANPGLVIGTAGLAFDGGGSTSSGCTFQPNTTTAQARAGILGIFKVAAGGGSTYSVSGSAAAISAATGAVTKAAAVFAVAGTAALLSGASGAVDRVPQVRAVSGTAVVVTDSSGAVTRPIRTLTVSGAAAATSGAAGDVTRPGTTAAVSGTAGTTSGSQCAAASIVGVTGSAAIASAVTGDVTRPARTVIVTGAAVGASGASCGVSVLGGPQTYPASGSIPSVTAASGAVTARAAASGSSSAVSAATGALGVRVVVTGTSAAATSASGDAAIVRAPVLHAVTGAVDALSGASGAVTATGANDGTAVPRGSLTLTIPRTELTVTTVSSGLTVTIPTTGLEVTA